MSNSRQSLAHWLWNHNPFYVVSALLMLYGVRVSYGHMEIGTIDCWKMMSLLGVYTLVLAAVGVLIVRWGKVWDDARSILLVLLLMFLAISVSADDLFVKMESAKGGAALMSCGFAFSVAVLLGVLSATRIRLRAVYLVPIIFFLGLFFVAPWWCAPGLHPAKAAKIDWQLFMFPQVAAVLVLTLIPAARMGESSAKENGTPWPWPLFPWSVFVFIAVAIVLRSYALTMTFSTSGPMWDSADNRTGIVLDTIWRPYFLVPFAFAALLVLVEAGLASGARRLVSRAVWTAPCLLLLAWPWRPSEVMLDFLADVTRTIGSPVWWTTWLLIAFYLAGVTRRIPKSEYGLFASILVLTIVGPNTIDQPTLTAPNPIPLFAVGIASGLLGLQQRSAGMALTATSLATVGLWLILKDQPFATYRAPICYHVLLAACVALSLYWNDVESRWLKLVGAFGLAAPAYLTLFGSIALQASYELRLAYVASLSTIALGCAFLTTGRAYRNAFAGITAMLGFVIMVDNYRYAASAIGREAMAAFSWSVGTLVIAFLISAQKAQWLPSFGLVSRFGGPTTTPDESKNPAISGAADLS